jgi:hypothetical protein
MASIRTILTLSLTHPLIGARVRQVVERKEPELRVQDIACPILSSLTSKGWLKPDCNGFVDKDNAKEALGKLGATRQLQDFLSNLIIYEKDDPHQENPTLVNQARGWINLFNMRKMDNCTGGNMPYTSMGVPCNSNAEKLQHGFSAPWRDTPSGMRNFMKDVRNIGALERLKGVEGRVITLSGMSKIIEWSRTRGDLQSAHTSYGPLMTFYHPNTKGPVHLGEIHQLAALLAWGAFWGVMNKQSNDGVAYITLDQLRDPITRGRLPKGFRRRSVGFKEAVWFAADLDDNASPEWTKRCRLMIQAVGRDASEGDYLGQWMQAMGQMNAFSPNVGRKYSGQRKADVKNCGPGKVKLQR